jgi:hypothetical protein
MCCDPGYAGVMGECCQGLVAGRVVVVALESDLGPGTTYACLLLLLLLLLLQVVDVKDDSYQVSSTLDLPGHRSDVRCLALSSDDMQVGRDAARGGGGRGYRRGGQRGAAEGGGVS